MNSKKILAALSCLVFFSCLATNASAGDVLKCEKRNSPPRSRLSVQAEDLVPGALYTATVTSGGNSALASRAADLGGKVSFDFDSNLNDILAGATSVASNFIVGGTAAASVTNAMGGSVVNTSATCRIR